MIWIAKGARVLVGLIGLAAFAAIPANAVECSNERFTDHSFAVCRVDVTEHDLRLFLDDPATGRVLGSFNNLADMLEQEGRRLLFAMNAGMYHPDRSPVGLFIEGSERVAPIVTGASSGNFGLLPNGVFCIRPGRVDVFETRHFARQDIACRFASQSGPMLVIEGNLHPRFLPDSDSVFIRNGVGTTANGREAYFVISREPLNFHTFARFFRDHLGLAQALYFDGKISKLFAPGLDRRDGGFPMGPIVGVVSDPAQ
ncbi:MAG: phosphodiester glycosidase family protein [Pseudomonadota bacterium]